MKKTFKLFAAALAIVAAASCAKEISNDIIQNENPAEETVHMTFSASIDAEEDTKTALNGKVVEWKESDNIKLFKNDYYPSVSGICAVVAGTISQDKKFADFEGDLVPSTDYIAAYPADWYVDRYGTQYRIDFPGLAEQVAVENSFDSSKHLMIANSLSDDNHFQFKNVCALAKVTIGTDDVYSVIVEGKSQFSTYGDYGSIGGALGCKTNDLSWYAINSNQVHSITLKNEDGSALRKGATYYIVLPACTIKNFTLSVCDQSGTKIGSRSKASDFVVERNKIYDLGTLEFKEVPFLNVSTTDVSIPKKGGSVTINIDSNVDWNINNLAGSWLTVSKTSDNKGCVFTAQANKESSKRPSSSTNYVIISGGGINHIIKVSQDYVTYRIDGSVLTRASDLTNGQMYVVRLQSENSRYWYATSSNLSSITQSSESEIPTQCVFVYKKDDSKATKSNYGKSYTKDYVLWKETYYYGNQYSYMSAGGWQSKYNDKYLTHDLGLSNYLDYYFTHMNGWINNDQKNLNTSEDFDIYRDGGSDMLNFNESSYFWGNGGITQYKWSFYKVVEN